MASVHPWFANRAKAIPWFLAFAAAHPCLSLSNSFKRKMKSDCGRLTRRRQSTRIK
jgi:hypothetical protein